MAFGTSAPCPQVELLCSFVQPLFCGIARLRGGRRFRAARAFCQKRPSTLKCPIDSFSHLAYSAVFNLKQPAFNLICLCSLNNFGSKMWLAGKIKYLVITGKG